MVKIQDIAQMSGYSIGTVSRVINNRPSVSEKARKKIETVIREQGFQPNANAKMLRQSVSSEITIIVRGINSIFLHAILEKVQIRIRERGETANVQFIGDRENEVATALQVMQDQKPKALIFLGGSFYNFQRDFCRISVPSVLIAADAEGLGYGNLSSFTVDDKGAASFAVGKLVSQGHRKIGILGGYPEDVEQQARGNPAVLRIQGAIEELERSGIAFDLQKNYEACPFFTEGGYQATKKLLARSPELTAIFAISDAVAIGAMRALQDMGLIVPKDISVVGFDGVMFSEYSIPRLATIQQDSEALARRGVDDLLMRLGSEGPAVHEKVPYRYVPGESVAQPRE